ncbi:MAG TPA: PP2C family protein-serine/threonine phosphatase [Pyrinomonadaceae bacterium]|nr:PP2C family protein-serine/threonine phosphatase [Pyrinomonadaceae bacterium]
MSQTLLNAAVATKRSVNVRMYPGRRRRSVQEPRENLESRLATLQKDYAELHTEIFEAAQVHRRLCAPRLVRHGNFEIASEIFAVRHLPGDFFTVDEKDGSVIMALGDICGKGLAAGMWTTHLVGLVGSRVATTCRPEAIVAGVNRDVCLRESTVPLASLFLAKLDTNTGLLNYCSAGHPPALLLRANGELELLSDGGLLLGVMAAAPYVSGWVKLHEGDVLMIYSDGITDSEDCAGNEFGDARLEMQLRRAQGGPADSVLFSVLGAVQDFAAACPLVDDMSVAIVRQS